MCLPPPLPRPLCPLPRPLSQRPARCLSQTICTVLDGLQGKPELYAQLEPIVCPVRVTRPGRFHVSVVTESVARVQLIERLFNPEGDMLEFFDSAVSLLSYFACVCGCLAHCLPVCVRPLTGVRSAGSTLR